MITGLDVLAARPAAHGTAAVPDGELPGCRRFPTGDPVGDRLEFLEPQ
ncbi:MULTISPECIES: hypothetical protein [unclassified Streptomyces]|nr:MULTISPECIES: hypothetical protein [unclassified Streptomyces]MCU4748592.1 hypothetical protein [Streptomyces sp. G-5]QQN79104.1 hypothetical protein IPZ77_17935 [Streptomyces sp. XC 2026]